MAFRLPAKREVFACFCLGLWFYGMCRLDIYTSDAYLIEPGSVYWPIILISVAIGAFASWRVSSRVKSKEGKLERVKFFLACFVFVVGVVSFTLWESTEAIIVSSATQTVSGTYPFRMNYPGPSCGKHCRCKAGVVYYDEFLKREIEFCQWDDASSFFYTDSIRVVKKVNAHGGKIISHEAIH
ncbi:MULTISPECIES: hypothetical protein [Enterobacter cloacae complex]|uniref:hypothetical protein n=1 Tax=Enterobacter cloacae complex TaxID=354276 RepID=UPI000288E8A0|nr:MULTISPECIES: hypothetical protein [Enterobacter cloacae complex]EJO46932.1 hypothetical protein B498_1943 [Enterobacter sp. SST3]MCK6840887.1 hypothetical protein [Enterobacter roggenkampii]